MLGLLSLLLAITTFCNGNMCMCLCCVLQAGAAPAAANAVSITPLLAAAGHGQVGCLQLLLRHVGPQAWQQLLAAKDGYGRTALHFAAASGGGLAAGL
jgi:ankyrin repeat protein